MKYTVAILALLSVTLAGCATMAGFGKDVQKLGQSIQRSATR
ncbi:MAG: entericidin A/B family lipoprotein [Betaproteobacteria bacterium]|nr:entericidin A/B family lipoprotein [Betaproteobacteria bacterium]